MGHETRILDAAGLPGAGGAVSASLGADCTESKQIPAFDQGSTRQGLMYSADKTSGGRGYRGTKRPLGFASNCSLTFIFHAQFIFYHRWLYFEILFPKHWIDTDIFANQCNL